MLRYACWLLIPARQFPYATLTVNSIGSFVIGLVLAYSLRETGFSDHWKIFLTTGVCGGFTTFSAFSAENLLLLQTGKHTLALIYILVSLITGIAATWLGFKLINP